MASLWQNDLVEHLIVQHHRDLVDRVVRPMPKSRLPSDVAEQGDLRRSSSGSGRSARKQHDVRLDADFAPPFTEWGRLGLISPADAMYGTSVRWM